MAGAPRVLTAGPPGARSRTPPYAPGWGFPWGLKEDVEGLAEPEWSADAERPAGVPLGLGLPGGCAVVMGRGLPAWHWAGPVLLVLDWVKPAGPAWQGGRWQCRPLGVDTPAPSPPGLSLWISVVKPSVSSPCLTHRVQRCARSRPQEVAPCEGQGGPRRPGLGCSPQCAGGPGVGQAFPPAA